MCHRREKRVMAMTAEGLAGLWIRDKTAYDEWADGYATRTGLSKDEVARDIQSHWIPDDRSKVIGTFDGYRLSKCPTDEGRVRFTVVTPWGQNEGLCDQNDDDGATERAKGLLSEVIRLIGHVDLRVSDKGAESGRQKAQASARRATKPTSKAKTGKRRVGRPRKVVNASKETSKPTMRPILAPTDAKVSSDGRLPLHTSARMTGRRIRTTVGGRSMNMTVWSVNDGDYVVLDDMFVPICEISSPERRVA